MSTSAPPTWEMLLDQHLSGRLDEAGRRAFEAHLDTHPQAREELELQRRINGVLRRRVQPGDAQRIWERVDAAQRAGRVLALQRRQRWLRRGTWAIAAALVLAVGAGVWLRWGRPETAGVDEQGYKVKPWRTFEMVYRDEVAAGFKCEWECKTDREFAGTFRKRFGQGLLVGQLPAGVHTLGLSYCNTLSRKTVILLAKVQDKDVLVFIDRPGQYDDLQIAANSGLHLFKRRLGQLVLCEVTPLDQPHLLDAFYDPQQPAAWYEQPATASQPAVSAPIR